MLSMPPSPFQLPLLLRRVAAERVREALRLTDYDMVMGPTYDAIVDAVLLRTTCQAPVTLPRALRNSGAHPATLFKNWSPGLCGLRMLGSTLTFSATHAREDAAAHGILLPTELPCPFIEEEGGGGGSGGGGILVSSRGGCARARETLAQLVAAFAFAGCMCDSVDHMRTSVDRIHTPPHTSPYLTLLLPPNASSSQSDTIFLLPLEDLLTVALVAAVQVYLRGGSVTGSFSREAVVEAIKQETLIGIGRSRLPGIVSAAAIEALLSPPSHGRTGFADVLLMLSQMDLSRLPPLPDSWVLPDAPLSRWPAAFRGERAVLVRGAQVGHFVAGFADRELVLAARARIGPSGDGGVVVTVTCFRCAPGRLASEPVAATVGIGCPRAMTIEAPLADLEGYALIRCSGAHAANCLRSSLHHDVLPAVVELAMEGIRAGRSNSSIMTASTVLNTSALAAFERYASLVREEGRIAPPPPRLTASGEVTTNPLAACRGRYGAAASASTDYADAASLLPTCICAGSGDGPLISCIKGFACVYSYAGEFHKACVLGRKAVPSGGYLCPGCSVGAPAVVTTIVSQAVLVSLVAGSESEIAPAVHIFCRFSARAQTFFSTPTPHADRL